VTDLAPTHTRPAPITVGAGRVCALLALASAIAHTSDLTGHGIGHTALMVAMSAACCVCAYHLWFHPRVRDWTLVAAMSVAMVAMHLNMHTAGTHSGHHRPPSTPLPESQVTGSQVPLTLALIETLFSTAMLFAVTRAPRHLPCSPEQMLTARRRPNHRPPTDPDRGTTERARTRTTFSAFPHRHLHTPMEHQP
jgi:hypothetical protein